MSKTIEIDPRAVAAEQEQLIEHYRNRNLLLSNTLLGMEIDKIGLDAEIERLKARLAELEPAAIAQEHE